MKKNEFRIITKKDYDFIPSNMLILRDDMGILYMAKTSTNWFTNYKTLYEKEKNEFEFSEKNFLKNFVKLAKAELKKT